MACQKHGARCGGGKGDAGQQVYGLLLPIALIAATRGRSTTASASSTSSPSGSSTGPPRRQGASEKPVLEDVASACGNSSVKRKTKSVRACSAIAQA